MPGAEVEAGGSDPLAAIRAVNTLATPDGTALLVLQNFHRFVQSAEIVQALAISRFLQASRTARLSLCCLRSFQSQLNWRSCLTFLIMSCRIVSSLMKSLVASLPKTASCRRRRNYRLCSTLAWGGPPGTRPCFVITSDDGRGVGKTIFADTACQVVGGATAISHKEDIGRIKTRILSPDSLTKRAALLDNVKTLKFSWDDMESLITSTTIGGHRMYAGEATRPNMLTWFVTLNGPSLSTDMSQRAIIIKVTRPPRTGAWHEETIQFIEKNRERIIADLIRCLRVNPVELQSFTRWATRERHVVARLAEPSAVQAVIRERQGDVDADAEEANIVESCFARQLRRLDYNIDTQIIFIPSETAADGPAGHTRKRSELLPLVAPSNRRSVRNASGD